MSYNRLRYDQCAYKTEINQSVGPLEYLLNPMKYENCQKCRHEFATGKLACMSVAGQFFA